jgi:hypothetical protein
MEKRASGQIVESGREARQGFRDRPVLMVLIASVGLGFLLLGAIWLVMMR